MSKKISKRTLVFSVLSVTLSVGLCIGSTLAWFTDSVTSSGNVIKSGTLDMEMQWTDGTEDPATTTEWKDAALADNPIFSYELWEPGYTSARHIQLINNGNLALKYTLSILPAENAQQGEAGQNDADLAQAIDVYYADPAVQVTDRTDVEDFDYIGTLREVIDTPSLMTSAINGYLTPKDTTGATKEVSLVMKMREEAGNDYQNKNVLGGFVVKAYAAQFTYESDSFDNLYDQNAEFEPGAPVIQGRTITIADLGLSEGYGLTVTANGQTIHSGDKVAPQTLVRMDLIGPTGDDEVPVWVTYQDENVINRVTIYRDRECLSAYEGLGLISGTENSFTNGTAYFKMPDYDVTIAEEEFCLAAGTMITLADGTKKAVENIAKGDELLVWNLETGSYDTAPVIFNVVSRQLSTPVIHTCFSDGTDVQVVREHGFFDLSLGQYVFINYHSLEDYIGDTFVKVGDTASGTWQTVTLESVWTEEKVMDVYSPITAGQLCCFTEDILSVSGSFQGLVNIFAVDTDTLKYDSEKMQADIDTYGLFAYEDYAGEVPYEIYEAFNGRWMNVSVGKGLITWKRIGYLLQSFSHYF